MDLTPIVISLKLAGSVSLLHLILTYPACLLSLLKIPQRYHSTLNWTIQIPHILPPTVVGFYLLLFVNAINPNGAEIPFLPAPFKFSSLVFAVWLATLHWIITPVLESFRNIKKQAFEVCDLFGAPLVMRLWQVLVPQTRFALYLGLVSTIQFSLGCFGIVFIVGGSLPGETKTASIAVYESFMGLYPGNPHIYAVILLCISGALHFTPLLLRQVFTKSKK